MRSGGVVGTVQEEVSCNRQPVPTRNPQPLSQGLTALPAPLTQGSQALRGTGIPYYSGFAEIFAYRPGGECRRPIFGNLFAGNL